jgi:alpha-beta hydrolase superfamily lysophospholipase
MAEHKERYKYFAEKLTAEGYAVFINDHRGHGKTAKDESEIGFFASKDGWNLVVEDMMSFTTEIRKDYPLTPLFLFGHSMGTLLVRTYLYKYDNMKIKSKLQYKETQEQHEERIKKEIKGVLLSGSPSDPKLLGKIGLGVARAETLRGKRKKSNLMNNLTFGTYNKKFKPNRTEFDWLSRDNENVDRYVNDPLCGSIFTASFFKDMLVGIKLVYKKDAFESFNKDLPLYILSGDDDPVGNYSKGVNSLYQRFKKAGVKDLTLKLYSKGRHEMLNETNKDEVISDILNWIATHIK